MFTSEGCEVIPNLVTNGATYYVICDGVHVVVDPAKMFAASHGMRGFGKGKGKKMKWGGKGKHMNGRRHGSDGGMDETDDVRALLRANGTGLQRSGVDDPLPMPDIGDLERQGKGKGRSGKGKRHMKNGNKG